MPTRRRPNPEVVKSRQESLKKVGGAVKKGVTTVLGGYLNATQKLADKIDKSKLGTALKKLPTPPPRHRRQPTRK